MEHRQDNSLHTLRVSRDFIAAHPVQLPLTAASGTWKTLDAQIADLETHQLDQFTGVVTVLGGTKRVHALRVALLRTHMTPISRIAHVALPDTQELMPLRIPRGDPSTEKLVAAARSMAQVAGAHADVFVAAGLPSDFVAQLKAAADALLQAKDARKITKGNTSGATKYLKDRLREARQSIHILDGLVRKELAGDTGMLKNWADTKRLPHARRSSAAAAGIAPPIHVVGSISPTAATVASTTLAIPAPSTTLAIPAVSSAPPAATPVATTTPATPTAPATPTPTVSATQAA